ncbi:hypothetical protein BDR04DRAFT_1086018, partial [Suillus decipiens]
ADAFKRVLHRQDYSSWYSQPAPLNSSSSAGASVSSSVPAPTTASSESTSDTGTGTNVNTQLVYAIDHLKVLIFGAYNPMRLQDIAIVTNTPLETDVVLLEKFKTDLYSYRHESSFRNKAALLTEIQRQMMRVGGNRLRKSFLICGIR